MGDHARGAKGAIDARDLWRQWHNYRYFNFDSFMKSSQLILDSKLQKK
jgi:hypothetical protein